MSAPESERSLSSPFDGVQILIVAANEGLFETIASQLKSWGCEVVTAASHGAARAHIRSAERIPDLLIGGCGPGDIEAVEIIHLLGLEEESFIPSFLITAERESQTHVQGGGVEILHLPVKPAELRALIAHLLQPPI